MKNVTTLTFLMALMSVFLAIPILQVAANDAGTETVEVTPSSIPSAPAAPSASDRPAAALATGATTSPEDAITSVVTNVRGGNWKLAVAAILSLLMTVLAKARNLVPFFKGDRGGSILVMVLALMGSFATALGTGSKVDLNLALAAIGVAFTAVGGWTWVNQMVRPADKKAPPANA
jgi:surface polysaccharide O-acyltransferase-like enzyme